MVPKNLVLLPTYEWASIYYDPEDLRNDRPLRLFRKRKIKGKMVIYEIKGGVHRSTNPNSRYFLRPRYVFTFKYNGILFSLLRSKATMLAYIGFAIADPRHWVIDHIKWNTLDDRLSNLRIVPAKENSDSPRIKEYRRLNNKEKKCRKLNRQAFVIMRRQQLINCMPEADKNDIDYEVALQLSQFSYEEIINELIKNGIDVQKP